MTIVRKFGILVIIIKNINRQITTETADLSQVQADFMSSSDAARELGITPEAASRLVRQGRLPGVKIGRSYVIPRESVDSFSIGYIPARGRPKTKRTYTKRSPYWSGKRIGRIFIARKPPALDGGIPEKPFETG